MHNEKNGMPGNAANVDNRIAYCVYLEVTRCCCKTKITGLLCRLFILPFNRLACCMLWSYAGTISGALQPYLSAHTRRFYYVLLSGEYGHMLYLRFNAFWAALILNKGFHLPRILKRSCVSNFAKSSTYKAPASIRRRGILLYPHIHFNAVKR